MGDTHNRAAAEEIEKLEAFWERAQPLTPYLQDPSVNEITVNEPKRVWLLKGGRWEPVDDPEITLSLLVQLGRRLANYKQEPFDTQNTSLSTKLPSGERVEMTHPPTCPEDVRYLNIRKHSAAAFPHEDLVDQGYYKHTKHEASITLTAEDRKRLYPLLSEEEKQLWDLAQQGKFAQFMMLAVKNYQNIVISGKTYSGKTSYMRSLMEMIDRSDRIITVEDTPELDLPNHPNKQHLFYKKTNTPQGATAKQVLQMIMRKSGDRILLAELRGDEAMFYLSGVLNSGHPGGMTTTHTGSPKEAFSRLALLILSSEDGKSLNMETILNMLHMTVNVVVQLRYDKELGRHIPGIYYDPMYRLSLVG